MSIRVARVLIVMAACLTGLGACSSAPKLGDLLKPNSSTAANDTAANDASNGAQPAEVTGSFVTQPAEPGPSGEPVAPLSKPGHVGDDPNDDLQLAKRYFRSNNFGQAEKSFRTVVEKRPNDAEAWVGLAASYDRLHRFDLADRAYAQAIHIVGETAEILNDQGFSYMLRGDYTRAHKKLQQAQAKDPSNPYVHANMQLLEEAYHDGSAIQ
jgi:tetratricopeptide (TPR) repeat protein